MKWTVNKCLIKKDEIGFELWTSDVRSNRSTNWTTTTALQGQEFFSPHSQPRGCYDGGVAKALGPSLQPTGGLYHTYFDRNMSPLIEILEVRGSNPIIDEF